MRAFIRSFVVNKFQVFHFKGGECFFFLKEEVENLPKQSLNYSEGRHSLSDLIQSYAGAYVLPPVCSGLASFSGKIPLSFKTQHLWHPLQEECFQIPFVLV